MIADRIAKVARQTEAEKGRGPVVAVIRAHCPVHGKPEVEELGGSPCPSCGEPMQSAVETFVVMAQSFADGGKR